MEPCFIHKSNARYDKKMLDLRIKFANGVGYAVYFMLLERLSTHKNAKEEYDLESITADLSIDEEIIRYIIEKSGLFVVANGYYQSPQLAEQIKPITSNAEEIKDFYNTHRNNMKKLLVMSDKRKKAINKLIKKYGKEKVFEVITMAGKAKWLNGNNDRGWVAGFDWIINETNFIKIMEDTYSNTVVSRERKQTALEKSNQEIDQMIDSLYGGKIDDTKRSEDSSSNNTRLLSK